MFCEYHWACVVWLLLALALHKAFRRTVLAVWVFAPAAALAEFGAVFRDGERRLPLAYIGFWTSGSRETESAILLFLSASEFSAPAESQAILVGLSVATWVWDAYLHGTCSVAGLVGHALRLLTASYGVRSWRLPFVCGLLQALIWTAHFVPGLRLPVPPSSVGTGPACLHRTPETTQVSERVILNLDTNL